MVDRVDCPLVDLQDGAMGMADCLMVDRLDETMDRVYCLLEYG